MNENAIKTKVTITLTVDVPTERCQEVSQALTDTLTELDCFNGTLEQSAIKLDI